MPDIWPATPRSRPVRRRWRKSACKYRPGGTRPVRHCRIRPSRRNAAAGSGLRWKTTYASVFSFDVVMAVPCSSFEESLRSLVRDGLVPGRTKSWVNRRQDLGIGCGNYGREQRIRELQPLGWSVPAIRSEYPFGWWHPGAVTLTVTSALIVPGEAARQLPDQSTFIRVRASLTDSSRPRGARSITSFWLRSAD